MSLVPSVLRGFLRRFKKNAGKIPVILGREGKWLYVPIGKNATGTIKTAIAEAQGLDPKGEVCRDWRKGRNMLFMSLRDETIRDYFKFAFVRDPFRRLVSAYMSKLIYRHEHHEARVKPIIQDILDRFQKRDVSFEEFVQYLWEDRDSKVFWNGHWKPQHFYLADKNGKIAVDFVGRLENLDADWEKICGRMGWKVLLDHKNRSKTRTKPHQEYYNAETARKVFEMYKEDFDIFGYPSTPF